MALNTFLDKISAIIDEDHHVIDENSQVDISAKKDNIDSIIKKYIKQIIKEEIDNLIKDKTQEMEMNLSIKIKESIKEELVALLRSSV